MNQDAAWGTVHVIRMKRELEASPMNLVSSSPEEPKFT
jgi:hypothetical protein